MNVTAYSTIKTVNRVDLNIGENEQFLFHWAFSSFNASLGFFSDVPFLGPMSKKK